MSEVFRFVVAATPKSGGEWVAGLLSAISGSTLANMQRIDSHVLASFPSNLVITTRELPNRFLIGNIRQAYFQTITVRRHPFDVLINLLFAANVDIETNTHFIDSLFQFEKGLVNVTPRHPKVLQYAASSRFKDLVAISSRWKNEEDTYSLTFEGLANNPQREMERIVDRNKSLIDIPLVEIIERQRKRRLGQPVASTSNLDPATSGIWRRLIPAIQAERLASLLFPQMIDLEYQCDPDLSLTADEADANWYRFMTAEAIRPLAESLQNYQSQRQVIGEKIDTSLQELTERLNSLKQFIESSPMHVGSLEAELINYNKDILKLSGSSSPGGLAWMRFSKIIRRLLGIHS